jgi:hypothetical protein
LSAARNPPEVLYAKHRLLPEVGPRGQEALCAARWSVQPDDAVAAEAAVQLTRSGMRASVAGEQANVTLARPEGLRAPSDPVLDVAFTALVGAVLATEHVRAIVGVRGRPIALPDALFTAPGPCSDGGT